MAKQRGKTSYERSMWRSFYKGVNAIVDDTSVDGNMMAVYSTLLRHSSAVTFGKHAVYGTYIGLRKIVALIGFSERKISYIMKKLEARGLVIRHRKAMGNTVTELVDPAQVYPAVYGKDDERPGDPPPIRDLKIVP